MLRQSVLLCLAFSPVLLAACGNEKGLVTYDEAPVASITAPEHDSVFNEGEAITFKGVVHDDGAYDALKVQFGSDLQGTLVEELVPDGQGNVTFATANMEAGIHVVTLRVTDGRANSDEDNITVEITAVSDEPTLTVVRPLSGENGLEGTPFEFVVQVADNQDKANDLVVTIGSDLAGPVCDPIIDALGVGRCSKALPPGTHLLTFTVTDTDDNTGVENFLFTVTGAEEEDKDGDNWSPAQGDCNDANPAINPAATEYLNNLDDDCDGKIDEGTLGYDDDGDGYCEAAPCVDGSLPGDCDDNPATGSFIYPGAPEWGNGKDDDCDGKVDEGLDTSDDDGDGFSEANGDCDDDDEDIGPAATDIPYNGVDEDCIDGDLIDVDEDGFIAAVAGGDDCDDEDDQTHPTATDVPHNDVDEDCLDGDLVDVDEDGFDAVQAGGTDCNDNSETVNPNGFDVPYDGIDQDCFGGDDLDKDDDGQNAKSFGGTDCNDEDDEIYLGAPDEPYDGIDQDCNGSDVLDFDGDGQNATTSGGTDCDDTNKLVYEGAVEIPYDEIDQDCSGADLTDVDGDGWDSVDADGDDCDDADEDINPGATEQPYNNVDEDCIDGDEKDFDNDGVNAIAAGGTDCNDTDDAVKPGGLEVCGNGKDDNCALGQDEENAQGCELWYLDVDGDSYGVGTTKCLCAPDAASNFDAANDDDCQDNPAQSGAVINPGRPETCTTVFDDNCDGNANPVGVSDGVTYYFDGDGDGYGQTGLSQKTCSPTGTFTATQGGDCNDNAGAGAAIRPGINESCATNDDDNCSGGNNDAVAGDPAAETYYADGDNDSFGGGAGVLLCNADSTYKVLTGTDCNDAVATINPGVVEDCNTAEDDNCAAGNNDAVFASPNSAIYYPDADNDNYGTSASSGLRLCYPTATYEVTNNTDCNDSVGAINPGALELCSTPLVDENCNGQLDEPTATGAKTWYVDADGDGYGQSAAGAVTACFATGVYTGTALGDCNDTVGIGASIHPNAVDACEAGNLEAGQIDQDCDNDRYEAGASGCANFFKDNDNDNYGVLGDSQCLCYANTTTKYKVLGTTSGSADCNDNVGAVNPGATEVCEGTQNTETGQIDNDCDGNNNEVNVSGSILFYKDVDNDTYGDINDPGSRLCYATATYEVKNKLDCQDGDSLAYPGAPERCSTDYSDDCDAPTNEQNAVGCTTFYNDSDNDGYGSTASQCWCAASGTYKATVATDCDDGDPGRSPGLTEVCNGWGLTQKDEDCDNNSNEVNASFCSTRYSDGDADGYGAGSSLCLCTNAAPYAAYTATTATDCNDGNGNINPGENEVCNNGIDDNCLNGQNEEGTSATGGYTRYYEDVDGDLYGNSSKSKWLCSSGAVVNYDTTTSGDCYDSNAEAKPGQTKYYTSHRGDSSYDYNCDNVASRRWTAGYTCSYSVWDGCDATAGWYDSVPSCGGSAPWADNPCSFPPCVYINTPGNKAQECR